MTYARGLLLWRPGGARKTCVPRVSVRLDGHPPVYGSRRSSGRNGYDN